MQVIKKRVKSPVTCTVNSVTCCCHLGTVVCKSLISYKLPDSNILQQDNNAGKWDNPQERSIIMYICVLLLPVPTPLRYSRHYNKLNFKSPFSHTQAYSSSFWSHLLFHYGTLYQMKPKISPHLDKFIVASKLAHELLFISLSDQQACKISCSALVLKTTIYRQFLSIIRNMTCDHRLDAAIHTAAADVYTN